MTPLIRFAHGRCAALRHALLHDTGREHFAMLTARHEQAPDGREIFEILETFMKEPAAIPFNAVKASMTVRTLLEQYRDDAVHQPVMVYESHAGAACTRIRKASPGCRTYVPPADAMCARPQPESGQKRQPEKKCFPA